MAMNQKSATLPANLRHATTAESKDSGGFFSKLKKRFRLRKGNYDIGVNTGECENISTVSFKKRESREGLSDVLRLSPGSTHKERSPLSRRPHRSHSDAVSPEKLKIKTAISPKHKRREDHNDASKTPKTFDLNNEPKRSSSLKYEAVKANEYSCIHFQNDGKARKPLDLESENIVKNDCLTVDDSAVDLDDDIAEPGYESLNEVKQRILSKDFSSDRKSERTRNLSEPHSIQVKNSRGIQDNVCSKTMDDSALSLVSAETSLHSSTVDPLTSSSKSRDSGFESSKTQNSPDSLPNIIASTNTVDAEDDDDELRLDPAYAECADAIKGTLPFAAYSEGSGSKLSSCQSLDATVDDIEPDYAECADALKTGSVRMRISVSNERLADQDKSSKTKSKEHIKTSSSSEVYANPQILFKKRSKVLVNDRSSGEFSNRSSDTDRNESFTFSSSESLQKDLKEEQSSSQAPPLPARNYSLYLENEEAAQILTGDDNSPPNSGTTNSSFVETNKTDFSPIDDNAFEDFGYSSVKETNNGAFAKTSEDSSIGCSSNKNIIDQNNEDFDENHFSCSVNYTKANESVDILDFGYASVDDMKAAKQSEENKFMLKKEKYDTKETNFSYSSVIDTKGKDFKVFDEQKTAATEQSDDIDNGDFGYATVKETTNKSTRISTIVSKDEPVASNTITKGTQEDESIDFGYASVKELNIKSPVNTISRKEPLAQSTNECDSNEGELEAFGYASVEKTNSKRTESSVSRKETVIPDTKETCSQEESMIDFGYASVKDTKRKDASELAGQNVKVPGSTVGEASLQCKETENVVSGSNITNRSSFEVKKMEYIKTLEEDFGYSSVNNLKRKSDPLPESEVSENSGTNCEFVSNVSERFKQTVNANSEDIGYSSVKKDSKDTSDTRATEQTINSYQQDCRSQLTLETCDCSFDKIEGEMNVLATSPISEVVSSVFLCSTPIIKDETDEEKVSGRSGSVIEGNSLEVTVLDKSGSCRVLKIIEKEEPTALVEKRRSVRSSQKRSVKTCEDENSSEQSVQGKLLVSTDTYSQQEFAHGHQIQSTERDERKNVISAASEITEAEKLCAKELQIDQSDISSSSVTDKSAVECISDQNIIENIVVSAKSLENLQEDYNSKPVQNVKISYQESSKLAYDDLKLPIRSNIQKVSYRSVTDSDSDDSDLKLENLPKLVIDESVFDDSDSSDNVNCSKDESKSEVAEAISNLTEQIEKELNPSEEVSDPIHMTLEEVLKEEPFVSEPIHMTLEEVLNEEPSVTQVESADSYSNSAAFDVNEAKKLKSENVHEIAKTVISKETFDEQNEGVQKERVITLESDNISTSVQSEETNLNDDSSLHLNIDELSEPIDSCHSSVAASGHPNQTCSAVPPRPPPPVCLSSAQTGKSDSGNDSLEEKAVETHQDGINSESGQSDQQSPDSESSDHNVDQLPLVFRPGSGSSQSDVHDDDSPPAIPPRVRIKKQMREASSCYKDFMESMRQLKDVGWYWGPLIWEEAEAKLANKAEGSFLVRDSSDERYILSLSFKHQGRVHHTRIEHHRGQFSFWSQPESHGKSTIKDFIEQCVDNSRNGRFLYFIRPSAPGAPPLPIHLLHPVSRFAQMRSLQHMCRFAILQMVRRDHIDDLPVPTRIKKYLQEAQYYVEYLED